MVVFIPNIVSWTEIYVCNVSGKISSLIIMSTGAGIALNPPFIGYLMDTYSSICFLYVLSRSYAQYALSSRILFYTVVIDMVTMLHLQVEVILKK